MQPQTLTAEEVRSAVAAAVCFSVRWKGPSSAARTQTLAEARKVAARLDRANGTKAARVYAVAQNDRNVLVPDSFEEPSSS